MQILLAALALLCPRSSQEGPTLAERLKDPAQVWPAFQEFVRAGEYGKAHTLFSADAKRALPYEAFFIGFTAFEAPRRLILTAEQHRAEALDPSTARIRICGPEFATSREIRLTLFLKKIWVLDFSPDDLDYLKGRALGWYRHQVRKADGWHFAYPPDWTYAPLARTCSCGK